MKLNLGNQIRINRRRMNLTQEQLAEKFCTSPQAISRWENGLTYPDIEMLPIIASFFGISLDAMLGCTEEEKKSFCQELEEALKAAVTAKDAEKAIELMRQIRRNLREYQSYWFWGMYNDIWLSGLFRNENVLEEMRLLTEEIFEVCPREEHFEVISHMSYMEDDEHIDAFLEAYASREDMARSTLMFDRYKMRGGQKEKIEAARQHILWKEIDDSVTNASHWLEYGCIDPVQHKWYCELQLNYINSLNCLAPDKKHIVSGGDDVDLWCFPRILLGFRYTAALSKLGELDLAYDAFEDLISLIERVMAIKDDEFELGCKSPALKGFTLKSKFNWLTGDDGKEYKDLCMQSDDWCNWIIPRDYIESMKKSWFEPVRADKRFEPLLERLNNCAVSIEAKGE